jgi:hypothetical protein
MTKEIDTMNTTRPQSKIRLFVATLALAAAALGVAVAPAGAAGIRNCVDITTSQSGRVACYELVWADGVEYRMTFSNQQFDGAAPQDLGAFYVLAPQTDRPQGAPPNTFPHDHVVRDLPAQNGGTYSVQLQGYFVLCSGDGIVSGACVPAWTSVGGPDPVPLATQVHGQPLTSVSAIESATAAGLVVPVNLGPDAVIVGSITGK